MQTYSSAEYERRDKTPLSPVTQEEEHMLGAIYERKKWLSGRRRQGKSRGFRVVGNRDSRGGSGLVDYDEGKRLREGRSQDSSRQEVLEVAARMAQAWV
jgi:hypothetical protein